MPGYRRRHISAIGKPFHSDWKGPRNKIQKIRKRENPLSTGTITPSGVGSAAVLPSLTYSSRVAEFLAKKGSSISVTWKSQNGALLSSVFDENVYLSCLMLTQPVPSLTHTYIRMTDPSFFPLVRRRGPSLLQSTHMLSFFSSLFFLFWF